MSKLTFQIRFLNATSDDIAQRVRVWHSPKKYYALSRPGSFDLDMRQGLSDLNVPLWFNLEVTKRTPHIVYVQNPGLEIKFWITQQPYAFALSITKLVRELTGPLPYVKSWSDLERRLINYRLRLDDRPSLFLPTTPLSFSLRRLLRISDFAEYSWLRIWGGDKP